jgi:ribosomal protein S11
LLQILKAFKLMGLFKITTLSLNTFLNIISIKKQYLKILKNQFLLINSIKQKNYKLLYYNLAKENQFHGSINTNVVTYVIGITFSRSNTFLHVMDSYGKLKFFSSAGLFNFKGKDKKSRYNVFKHFLRVLTKKLTFLRDQPIALHLKNVRSKQFWVVRRLKKKFFIVCLKIFDLSPFNGCRNRKIKRKKFRSKKLKFKKSEEVAEWFKAADCKSVEKISSKVRILFSSNLILKNI